MLLTYVRKLFEIIQFNIMQISEFVVIISII